MSHNDSFKPFTDSTTPQHHTALYHTFLHRYVSHRLNGASPPWERYMNQMLERLSESQNRSDASRHAAREGDELLHKGQKQHPLSNIQPTLTAIRELYSSKNDNNEEKADENNATGRDSLHHPIDTASTQNFNINEELWKWYDDARLRLQFDSQQGMQRLEASTEDTASSLDQTLTSMKDTQLQDLVDRIYDQLEEFFNHTEAASSHNDTIPSMQHILQTVQSTWNEYFPQSATVTQKQNAILTKHRKLQQLLSSRQTQVDELFLELSQQLDQHLSFTIVSQRWKRRQKKQRQLLSLDCFLDRTKHRLQDHFSTVDSAIPHLQKGQQSMDAVPEDSPIPEMATDADCASFAPLFCQAYQNTLDALHEKKKRRIRNMYILTEFMKMHYEEILEAWSLLNKRRVVVLGDFRCIQGIDPSYLHQRLQSLSLYDASRCLYEVLVGDSHSNGIHTQLTNLMEFLLHMNDNSAKSSEQDAPRSSHFQQALHPGFYRLFKRYLRALLRHLFAHRSEDRTPSTRSIIAEHFPCCPKSEQEFYSLVVAEYERLEFEHNEEVFKRKYLKEFAFIIPKDVATQNSEVVLRHLIETGQIEVGDVSREQEEQHTDDLQTQLFHQAQQGRPLPIPSMAKKSVIEDATDTNNATKKSLYNQFQNQVSHKRRMQHLYKLLDKFNV